MRRRNLWLLLSLVLVVFGAGAAAQRTAGRTLAVENPGGQVIKVIDESGNAVATRRPDDAQLDPGDASRTRRSSDPVTEAPSNTAASAGESPLDRSGERVVKRFADGDLTVDENGVIRAIDGSARPAAGADSAGPSDAAMGSSLLAAATIDRMTTRIGYSMTHPPGGSIALLGSAVTYYLSDGTSWDSGAGSYMLAQAALDHVEITGGTIRYVLTSPGIIYQQTDYDSGDHSAHGTLSAAGPLVIEASSGSNKAVMKGAALITANDATYYGEPRFNYYSAVVGSVVPFELTYTLGSGTWTADIFQQAFNYSCTGLVNFGTPISVPALTGITISGSAQVPAGSSVQFAARAHYDSGTSKDVTGVATWSVEPASLASISGGLLTTQPITSFQETLTIHASHTEGGVTVQADKQVICRTGGSEDLPDAWEMYQGNSRHTGFVPINLEPAVFGLLWQRTIASGYALNPVTAAEGRVFVSLLTYFQGIPSFFTLDARDGEILWSKNFGDVFSVNPPSYAYGNVYIQTGNHGSDTYLRAYDAASGDPVFQAPHSAQWERYYAPTIDNGTVYVNGGYYGGMYAFDAFSGDQRWFLDLPQYDEWTPAVDANYAYAYVGEYAPAVYAANRATGTLTFTVPDPNFDWNGWSMDLAPVLGSHDDLVAIHDGRLISFNLSSRIIRWEMASNFQGQPSIAQDAIFAIEGGKLVVLDEVTGIQSWSWQPPSGQLRGAMIVTNTHLFATTDTTVYAVDLLTRTQAWSYPAAGHLALGNQTLYIASADGTLTAISMPEQIPAAPASLEIGGPATVMENSTAQYAATVHYEDGRVRDRTLKAEWSVSPSTYASLDAHGLMTVGELLDPAQDVVVSAAYTENGVTVEASLNVRLTVGVTLEQLVGRNIRGALDIKRQLLENLETALAREEAVLRILSTQPYPAPPSVVSDLTNNTRHAVDQEELARSALRRSMVDLLLALDEPGPAKAKRRTYIAPKPPTAPVRSRE